MATKRVSRERQRYRFEERHREMRFNSVLPWSIWLLVGGDARYRDRRRREMKAAIREERVLRRNDVQKARFTEIPYW